MKKQFYLFVLLFFPLFLQAQNVGIGTTTPLAKLQINHQGNTTVGLQLLDSGAFRLGSIKFSTINNPAGMYISGNYQSSFNKDHYLHISSDTALITTFRGDGTVGIGTTTPTEKLEVKNALKSTVKISSESYNDTSQLILSNRINPATGTDFLITSIRETGLFFSSLSDISVNNSPNSLVIRPNGNVGMGVNIPANRLQLHDSGSVNTYMRITNSSTGISGNDGLVMGQTGASAELMNLENGNLRFGTNNLTRMLIDASGNVGIGIFAPLSLMHLHDAATSNSHLRFSHSTTGSTSADGMRIGMSGSSAVITNLENSNMLLGTNNTTRVLIDAAGNVGIGNFSPTNKLDVGGDFNVSGLLKIDNNSGTAGQVLVSNGASSPGWQSVANPQTGFNAEQASAQTLVQFAQTKINFSTEVFDDGSDYNNATSTFVVPATGVYHFDAHITFIDADPGSYRLFLDNNTSIADGEYARSYCQVSNLGSTTISISITLKLTVGASVLVHAWHGAVANQSAGFGYFSSHRVY